MNVGWRYFLSQKPWWIRAGLAFSQEFRKIVFQRFLQLCLREQPDHPRIGCRADLKFGYYLDAFNDIQQRHACRRPVINVARAGDPANR